MITVRGNTNLGEDRNGYIKDVDQKYKSSLTLE